MIKDIIDYQPNTQQEAADKELILQYLDQNGLYLRSNLIAHYTSSGFIMNKTLDKVLFAYHNIYDSFAWSGGHNDGNQDFLSVALKEAEEELGVKNLKCLSNTIDSLDVLNVDSHIKNGKYISEHLHFNVTYILIGDENEPIRIKADENSAVKWIKVLELNKYVTEAKMLKVYKKIIASALQLNS
jgi:ADP-ribose pyrophosphatase YjhB (NUDIX family)